MKKDSLTKFLAHQDPKIWKSSKEKCSEILGGMERNLRKHRGLWLAHFRWEFLRRSRIFQNHCNKIYEIREQRATSSFLDIVGVYGSIQAELDMFRFIWDLNLAYGTHGSELIYLYYEYDFEEFIKCLLCCSLKEHSLENVNKIIDSWAEEFTFNKEVSGFPFFMKQIVECHELRVDAAAGMEESLTGTKIITQYAELLKPQAEENRKAAPGPGRGHKEKVLQKSVKPFKPINTTKEAAKHAGVSTDTDPNEITVRSGCPDNLEFRPRPLWLRLDGVDEIYGNEEILFFTHRGRSRQLNRVYKLHMLSLAPNNVAPETFQRRWTEATKYGPQIVEEMEKISEERKNFIPKRFLPVFE